MGPPPCARKRLCCNRSRSDQLPQGDPRCPDAAWGSDSGLVPAAGGGAGNPEPLPEPARPGEVCHPAPQRVDRGAGPEAAATAIGFRLSVLLPPGGCCSSMRRDP